MAEKMTIKPERVIAHGGGEIGWVWLSGNGGKGGKSDGGCFCSEFKLLSRTGTETCMSVFEMKFEGVVEFKLSNSKCNISLFPNVSAVAFIIKFCVKFCKM